MKVEEIPLDRLRPNPWNPNVVTARMRRAARESIKLYGFVLPILVRPTEPEDRFDFEIIDGEHRWREAAPAGFEEIPCVVAEDLTDAEAKKLTVVLAEVEGERDARKLGKLLGEIQAERPADFTEALPYSEQELDALIALGPEALHDAGSEPEEEWRSFSSTIPRSFLAVYQACEDRVSARLAEEGKVLHPKRAVRRGQVLEILAAEYLAGS